MLGISLQPPNLTNRKLIFIRHAEFWKHVEDKNQHLTEIGTVQASTIGSWMKENYKDITRMWHSQLTRSVETARIIAQSYRGSGMELCSSKMLNEIQISQTTGRIEVGR